MLKKPKNQKVHANKVSLIPEAVTLVYIRGVALLSLTEFWYMTIVPKAGKSNKVKNTWVEEDVSGNEYSKGQSTRIIAIIGVQN